jgi:membrane associated rhomboid family serine protease
MSEFRPSSFQVLPSITKNLIIINCIVFLAQNTIGLSLDLNKLFALHNWQNPAFKSWQIITHLFMHADLSHIFFNMMALWVFGSVLESVWGAKRFLIFYFACGLGAAFAQLLVGNYEISKAIDAYNIAQTHENELLAQGKIFAQTIGASGAVYGCLAGMVYLFPNYLFYIYMFPIKVKWLVLIYWVREVIATYKNNPSDNVAHFAHLGGAIIGFVLVLFWNKTNRKTFY